VSLQTRPVAPAHLPAPPRIAGPASIPAVLSTTPPFGAEIAGSLAAVAALRIAVFREFPYLYDGDLAYEEQYLAGYAASPHSLVVVARDGDNVVGASTAMPLTLAPEAAAPLVAAGVDPARVYYFGESVLLPAYRGRGLGHQFFDHREAAARRFGFSLAAFCAVVRPEDHPLRPAGYTPHDAFWARRGFVRRPELVAHFSWRELGEAAPLGETEQSLVLWTKELA
jgi:GNAT superfamily N-acetyltransferase